MGGERMPPKLALVVAVAQALVAAGWILLALDGGIVGWKRWLLGAAAAIFVLQAVYFAALVVHRRRRR
ncbi:hypothetical protein [Amycolatopsis vastitatis]|uniref:Uncharacterized protein n=1 Tax=Amycolatopsis vastitatis TaxID=1905142 RepID=A0A229SJT4_9PSEU|nr:hypothetical protein [Amycolatopsis vastitatis]OXM59205.1 hypothetical protein CF165_48795 [Amycolatopsis vastitatis]